MKSNYKLTFILVLTLFCQNVLSQKQVSLLGLVVDDAGQPLTNISLHISHIGNIVSDSNGEFERTLPAGFGPGDVIDFTLQHETLAIFEPTRGIWTVPKSVQKPRVQIILLPKRDHRLLSRASMRVLMNERILEETKKLRSQITELSNQPTLPVSDPLAEEAQRLGFTRDELLATIDKVKTELQKSEDPYDVGLAALYDKHFSKAVEFIEKSIKADERVIEEKKAELPQKWLNLGNAHKGEHNLSGAITAYNKAIELRPEWGDAHLLLGSVYFVTGNADGMLRSWRQALAIYHEENAGRADQKEGAALGNLGVVFSALGLPDSARVYHEAALKIDREIGYRQGEGDQLGNLGLVFSALGLPDSARVYHEAALKIDREIGYRLGEGSDLGNLGLVFSDLGLPDSARVYHEAALKIHREIGYRLGEGQQLIALALVFNALGHPDSALVYHKKGLVIHREIGFRQGEATALGNLGVVFSALGLPDSARVFLLQSHRIFLEIRSPRADLAMRLVNSINEQENQRHLNTGDNYIRAGNPDSAAVFYEFALQDSRKFAYKTGEANALGKFSYLYHELQFQFQAAFEIDGQRLQLEPANILFLSDFAEKHFTTGRFPECARRLSELINSASVGAGIKTAMRAIEIANFVALEQKEEVMAGLATLITAVSKQTDSFRVTWSFTGSKHFIGEYEPLSPYRSWLHQLFTALEGSNRQEILTGLSETQASWQAVAKIVR